MADQNQQVLAIASVPCQTWGETYDSHTALAKGTIFPELNKPFFKADDMDDVLAGKDCRCGGSKDPQQKEREDLLMQINEVSFVINDLTLYLDTHEKDKNALSCYEEAVGQRMELMKEFAQRYYPLSLPCAANCEKGLSVFSWTEGPMPWEGACI